MNATKERIERIKQCLEINFHPTHLKIDDDSHHHAGHPGARAGLGHFKLEIEAEAFQGKSLMESHRMIYAALGNLMQTDIHAIQIKVRSQYQKKG